MQNLQLFPAGAQNAPGQLVPPGSGPGSNAASPRNSPADRKKKRQETYKNERNRQNTFNATQASAKLSNCDSNALKPLNFQESYAPTSYMITIQGCDELALEDTMFSQKIGPTSEKRHYVQYHATFHNSALKSHLGFFGRTYKSQMLPLVESLKQPASGSKLLRCEVPEFVYFHSSLKNEHTRIIVEVVMIEETVRAKDKAGGPPDLVHSTAGYAVIDPSKLTAARYNITSGSPRLVGIGQESQVSIQ